MILPVDQIRQLIQQRIVAADDDQGVLQLPLVLEQPDADLFARRIALLALRDLQHPVRLHEGGHHAASPGQWGGHQRIAHIAHAQAHVFLILEARDHLPRELCARAAALVVFPAVPGVDQRLQEFLDHDDAGHRIAGHAQNGLISAIAQDRGLAGLDGDAVVQHLADLAYGGGGVVVPPGGGAGVEDHHVALVGRFGEHIPNGVKAIRHDGIGFGLRAPVLQHGGKDGGIEFQNVARFGIGAGRDDLVAGGDDAHHRAADDLELQHAARDHGADGGGGDLHEAGQDHLPGADILADLPDMLPGRGGRVDRDAAVVVFHDILHHDDRVAVLGDRIAGVHHDKLVLPQGDGRRLGGAEAVPCAQSHAVHGAGRVMRRVDPGVDRAGRDAPV